MIDLENRTTRINCGRCEDGSEGPNLEAAAVQFAGHVKGCCVKWPEVKRELDRFYAEHASVILFRAFADDWSTRIARAVATHARNEARAALEARRPELERQYLMDLFSSDPQAAQALVLAQLSETVARMGAKVEQIASQPPVIQNVVQVPQQPPPVVENHITVPPGPAPVVNVENKIELPPRKDREIKFETDKNGNITGAKVKAT